MIMLQRGGKLYQKLGRVDFLSSSKALFSHFPPFVEEEHSPVFLQLPSLEEEAQSGVFVQSPRLVEAVHSAPLVSPPNADSGSVTINESSTSEELCSNASMNCLTLLKSAMMI